MKKKDINFQLAPPNVHCRNAAERAIRTFKNHFIAGLCSVDKHFPLHLWDPLLVPQALLTLNLLRDSCLNPKLSSWAQLNGHFDFNQTPIAPPGIHVLVHGAKPSTHSTSSPHTDDGWYVGPALDSYHCYTVWMFDSRAERISDTISWFPTKVTMPLSSSNDLIVAGIHDILEALQHPSVGSPLAPLTDNHVNALCQLSTLLTGLSAPDPQPLLPSSPAAPALRVAKPTATTPPRGVELATAAPPLRVHFTEPPMASGIATAPPIPPPTPEPTYANRTGIQGRCQRCSARNRT